MNIRAVSGLEQDGEAGEGRASSARSSANEDGILLGVLDVIERDASVTQRSVASELGIALGLANAYLRRCVRKGLVKVSQVPHRRYAYYLTPQGFAEKSRLTGQYLAASFSFFRLARAQCADVFARAEANGHRRLGLGGDGDLAEIASLIANEHQIEIAGIVPACADLDGLKDAFIGLGPVDGVMITALQHARETLDTAIAVFGVERVYVPPLLRLRVAAPSGTTDEAV